MTAMLLLLALLSFATLASRQGYFAAAIRAAGAPLLLAAGYVIFSAEGLAFVDRSTADALLRALRVGNAWLGLLIGLSAPLPAPQVSGSLRRLILALGVGLAGWLLISVATYGAAFGVDQVLPMFSRWAPLTAIGAFLALGGVFQGSGRRTSPSVGLRSGLTGSFPTTGTFVLYDELIAVIAACVAVGFTAATSQGVYSQPGLSMLILAAIGLLSAAVVLLIARAEPATEARIIALLGLVTLIAGLTAAARLPEAAAAFVLGLTLSKSKIGRSFQRRVAATERPVRVVVFVLIGMHLGIDLSAALIGIGLALARLLFKVGAARFLRGQKIDSMFGLLLPVPRLALPMIASVVLCSTIQLHDSALLTAAVFAICTNDLVAVVRLLRRAAPSIPAENEVTA